MRIIPLLSNKDIGGYHEKNIIIYMYINVKF